MADTPSTPPNAPDAEAPQIRILAQYVKDLSFENPGAPIALRSGQTSPAIDLAIDVQARKHDDAAFEIELNIEAKATRDDDVVFLAELKFAGLFQFVGITQDQLEPILLIECPRMLFPFARRIVADVTRDGGFPPLFIDPIDFASLYRAQREKAAAAAEPLQNPIN